VGNNSLFEGVEEKCREIGGDPCDLPSISSNKKGGINKESDMFYLLVARG